MALTGRATKKRVTIEFVTIGLSNADAVAEWCNGTRVPEGVSIPTLEGDMLAGYQDKVIRGVQGEFYPCKPDIFEQTYDVVEEHD